MTARSALHAVVQHASDADEAEFNRRLDAYAAEVRGAALQDAKADRGAIRCFLGDAPLLREVTAERDRARRIAVALEQEVAELTRRLAEARAEALREAAVLVARFTGNDLDANAKMLRRAADEATQ